MKFVRKNGPRILLTHAKEDTVVPFESAANFCNAYRNAGSNILFYQYSAKDEANTGGHAIWRKDYPVRKRLLNCIENEIVQFMGISETTKTAENDNLRHGVETFNPERSFRGVWVATVYDHRFSEKLSKKSVDGIKAYWRSILDAAERSEGRAKRGDSPKGRASRAKMYRRKAKTFRREPRRRRSEGRAGGCVTDVRESCPTKK
jgi:hypothetical protein